MRNLKKMNCFFIDLEGVRNASVRKLFFATCKKKIIWHIQLHLTIFLKITTKFLFKEFIRHGKYFEKERERDSIK